MLRTFARPRRVLRTTGDRVLRGTLALRFDSVIAHRYAVYEAQERPQAAA